MLNKAFRHSVAALLLAVCSESAEPVASSSLDHKDLVLGLRKNGATVSAAGTVSQPFFSPKGRILMVDGEEVQVFEYKNARAADAEASRVSSNGSTVGTAKMSWLGPPHFYRNDRLIVLYVGSVASVKAALEAILGPQFAGR